MPQIVPLVRLADLPFESAPARIAALSAAPKRSVIRWRLRRARWDLAADSADPRAGGRLHDVASGVPAVAAIGDAQSQAVPSGPSPAALKAL